MAQLSTGPEHRAPVALTTVLTATGYAADAVLTYLDGGAPRLVGTTVEISGPGREQRRSWSPHPRCECTRHRRPRTSQPNEVQ